MSNLCTIDICPASGICKYEQGVCCNADGQLMNTEAVCDQGTVYACGGSACGDDVQYQNWEKHCDGKTSKCEGEVTYGEWVLIKDCGNNQLCITDGATTVHCETCDYGCNKNVCLIEDPTVQVSTGWYHTCGLKSDGSIFCWGLDDYGQATPRYGNTGFTQVSAGSLHTCGLKGYGSVYCWGWNEFGQATPRYDNTGFTQVSAGEYHNCGLKDDGSIFCWGLDDYGQATPPYDNTGFTQVRRG